MIAKSDYYSLIDKNNVVVMKGTKAKLMKVLKANRGVYSLALTSKKVGEVFGS